MSRSLVSQAPHECRRDGLQAERAIEVRVIDVVADDGKKVDEPVGHVEEGRPQGWDVLRQVEEAPLLERGVVGHHRPGALAGRDDRLGDGRARIARTLGEELVVHEAPRASRTWQLICTAMASNGWQPFQTGMAGLMVSKSRKAAGVSMAESAPASPSSAMSVPDRTLRACRAVGTGEAHVGGEVVDGLVPVGDEGLGALSDAVERRDVVLGETRASSGP